jgi:prevent-host-death family protein
MTNTFGHNGPVESYNVGEAKAHFSEILERVSEGEEVLLTRRGKPIARVVPAAQAGRSVLGAGQHDPNIDFQALAKDEWWKPMPDDESRAWYE